jgi:hypothetical protein
MEKVLSKSGYVDLKPYDPIVLLRKNEMTTRDEFGYFQIIGLYMYLTCSTRHNNIFDMRKLRRFVSKQEIIIWTRLGG